MRLRIRVNAPQVERAQRLAQVHGVALLGGEHLEVVQVSAVVDQLSVLLGRVHAHAELVKDAPLQHGARAARVEVERAAHVREPAAHRVAEVAALAQMVA